MTVLYWNPYYSEGCYNEVYGIPVLQFDIL